MDVGTAAVTSKTMPPPEEVKLTPQELIQATWDELGYKIRPLYAKVFVRTELPPQRIGLIWLPPKFADFHGGMAHQRICTATVLSVGPKAKLVKVGERVCFQRLHFGFIQKLADKTFVGWIEQEQLSGYPADNFHGALEGSDLTEGMTSTI